MDSFVFQREDFSLCVVPAPPLCPQSQTHSGVALYNGKYFLTTTPYPNKRYSRWQSYIRLAFRVMTRGILYKDAEIFENPCLYVGEAQGAAKVPPTSFKPLTPFPLMPNPKIDHCLSCFNSDPDIFVDNNHCYILNRTVCRTKKLEHGYDSVTKIFLIEGSLERGTYTLESIKQVKEWQQPFVSPCLTKYRGKYLFTYIDSNSANDAQTFRGLYVQQLDSISELGTNNNYKKVSVEGSNILPWHMSLFQHEGKLYSIIACVKPGDMTKKIWQMFGEFNNDLSVLKIYPKPLTEYNSYRGAACVREDGMFILYSTTVGENISGANAVDGRNIIMAQMDFEKLKRELSR